MSLSFDFEHQSQAKKSKPVFASKSLPSGGGGSGDLETLGGKSLIFSMGGGRGVKGVGNFFWKILFLNVKFF